MTSGRRTWRPRAAVAALALLAAAGCGTPTNEAPAIANPASEHCIAEGGTLALRDDPDGGQLGICVFADGSECEEWAYYRGECAPGERAP